VIYESTMQHSELLLYITFFYSNTHYTTSIIIHPISLYININNSVH